MEMQEFINPEGVKKIEINENNQVEKIVLQDFSDGSREFSLEVFVTGENAKVEIIGRAESKSECKKNWNVSLILAGKNQSGLLDLKGVADENGFLEFDGGGIIAENSSEGSIKVEEKIILFSKNSAAKAVPVLRVETENVASASHAASIAPFDPEIFFYLESKGIHTKDIKKMLKDGMLEL